MFVAAVPNRSVTFAKCPMRQLLGITGGSVQAAHQAVLPVAMEATGQALWLRMTRSSPLTMQLILSKP